MDLFKAKYVILATQFISAQGDLVQGWNIGELIILSTFMHQGTFLMHFSPWKGNNLEMTRNQLFQAIMNVMKNSFTLTYLSVSISCFQTAIRYFLES